MKVELQKHAHGYFYTAKLGEAPEVSRSAAVVEKTWDRVPRIWDTFTIKGENGAAIYLDGTAEELRALAIDLLNHSQELEKLEREILEPPSEAAA